MKAANFTEESYPSDGRKLHIVMFPWLAFGHLIPFFELSKLIASKGHRVSFISTPRNIQRLPAISPDLASSLSFVAIPLPEIEKLPENAESTMDLSPELVEYLKKAFDGMEAEVTMFLKDSGADSIIYDFAAHWLPPVAADLGMSRFLYWILPSWFLAFMGNSQCLINDFEDRKRPEDFTVPPNWVSFDTNAAFKYYEAKGILTFSQKNASGFSDTFRVGKTMSESDAVIVRHCDEFETKWFKILQNINEVEIIPLGFMPPQVEEMDYQKWNSLKDWLDNQDRGSVIYIAFGSEVALNQDQLNELALGLELSQLSFLWVYRNRDTIKLPHGFEERTSKQGVVWKGWVPQWIILNHESVGGFLSHCGMSSMLEGLMSGLPFVCVPVVGDQWLNARILVEKQLGVEVTMNDEDGSFTRESVAESVRTVMIEEGGQLFRYKAKAMKSVLGDRVIHDMYVDNFIRRLTFRKT